MSPWSIWSSDFAQRHARRGGDDSPDRRLARAEQNTATRVDTARRAMPSWQILNTYERG